MSGPERLGFRYARSADGTSIAWARLGSGPPLVVVPPVPFSNVNGDWSVPLLRGAYERLASNCEVILYDGRGTGASARTIDDLSTEAQASDLEAVIADTGLERAALLALYLASAPALTLAARRPELVSGLVLFGAEPDGAEALARPGTEALLSLIDTDWALFSQTAALDWMGWRAAESGELVARSFQTVTTAGTCRWSSRRPWRQRSRRRSSTSSRAPRPRSSSRTPMAPSIPSQASWRPTACPHPTAWRAWSQAGASKTQP